MARTDEEDAPWTRQLLVGVGALVVVALLIGGIVSVFALGAAKVTGVGGSAPAATAKPSLYIPSEKPTTKVDTYPAPSGGPGSGRPTATPSSPRPTKKKPPAIELKASPPAPAAGERITLTGTYRGHDGARLQVQRFDGGAWVDFPVQATVTGGVFSTYIVTTRTGVNRLRVTDPADGRRSAAVRVTVG
jgi:hypothetical protein